MPNLAPVTKAHRLDEHALATHLESKGIEGFSKGSSVTLLQFQGGQSNPTYLIEAGTEGGKARKYVLRKKPPGELLPSAHQIEREFKAMKALEQTDVPVPACLLLEEDPAIIGTAFYVMDYLEGRVFDEPNMPGISAEERAACYASMNKTLAALHAVDPEAIGLGEFGRPQGYIERQVSRWTKQYRASEIDPIPAMDHLIDWLPQNQPTSDMTGIAHGDFRVGNLMFAPDRPEVIAVLDWELATLGHPLADLAYNCMPWRLPHGLKALKGVLGLDLPGLGIPKEQTYIEAYAKTRGLNEIKDWPFYMAFAMFRLAAICQGVKARAVAGNASSENAHDIGDLAPILAKAGWDTASA